MFADAEGIINQMKILKILIMFSLSHSSLALTIKNAMICNVSCNSESLHIIHHDKAMVGKIYYADESEFKNPKGNPCVKNIKTVKIFSDRLIEESLKSCVDVLMGKFRGRVDMDTDFGEPDHRYFKVSLTSVK